MDGVRCAEFLSKDRLEKTVNGQLSEGLVVHVNHMPDGKKLRVVHYSQLLRSHRTQRTGLLNFITTQDRWH